MAIQVSTLDIKKIQTAFDDAAAMLKKVAGTSDSLTERIEILGKSFAQAKAASKFLGDGLKQAEAAFQDFGAGFGLAEDFAIKQTDAFKKQNEKVLKDALRDIQSETGASDEEMNRRYRELGGSGEAFGWKPELLDWLEDRQASLSASADKYLQTFLDDTLPKRLGEASDAFAGLFSGIAFGTKNSSDLFADLGKSVLQTAQSIATDLMQVGMRFALFGSKENGWNGLFGSLVSGIGSWLGGGFNVGGARGSSTGTGGGYNMGGGLVSGLAHGGTFAAGTGLAALRNSIVSQPTYFPFAHGIGLMGEAGAEAIMPLERNSQGDLAVNVTGVAGGGGQVVNNVTVNAPPGAQVETRENRNATGGFDTEVLITMVENGIAQRIAGGTSRLAAAYDRTRGINRAGSLYRS